MQRKFPLVSVTALLTLVVVVICAVAACKPSEKDRLSLPETVSVYVVERSEIITLSYEDFITGCVFGMLSPKSEKEALKSAACAANTTALYLLENRKRFDNNGADFSTAVLPYQLPEDTRAQYGDSCDRYIEKVAECAREGIRSVILYDGSPICAACCAISSGKTDNAAEVSEKALPYLSSVSCEFDKEAKGYESSSALTADFVCKALRGCAQGAVLSGHPEEWFSEPSYSAGGTLLSVDYGGVTLTGAQLRSALGLRSAAIHIEYGDDQFKFTCFGSGDNLGMSLNGANVLALQGEKMPDILMYFYSGCEIKSAY